MRKRSLGVGRVWKRQQDGGSIFVGDWRDSNGKRQRRVLCSDHRVAERMLADVIRKRDLVVAGLAIEGGFERPAQEVIDAYLDDVRARRSKKYATRVTGVVNHVREALRARKLGDFEPQAFLRYRQKRVADGVANRTINMDLVMTRAMLNWAVRAGIIAHNPLLALQALPAGRGYEHAPRRALSDDEITRLLAASASIDQESAAYALASKTGGRSSNERRYAAKARVPTIPQTPLWLALLLTGARFTELVSATWADFDATRSTFTLRACNTKTRRQRVLPVRRELVEALAALRVAQHAVLGRIPAAGDLIFLSPRGKSWVENGRRARRRLEEVLERAGIPRVDARGEKVDIHSLRHTFASRLARNGVGLVQAQKLLGHSDPKLTAAIYTHLDTEDLRGAVEGLPALKFARG